MYFKFSSSISIDKAYVEQVLYENTVECQSSNDSHNSFRISLILVGYKLTFGFALHI